MKAARDVRVVDVGKELFIGSLMTLSVRSLLVERIAAAPYTFEIAIALPQVDVNERFVLDGPHVDNAGQKQCLGIHASTTTRSVVGLRLVERPSSSLLGCRRDVESGPGVCMVAKLLYPPPSRL